jgi:uncharacterized protein YlxW (UPF0749 family)
MSDDVMVLSKEFFLGIAAQTAKVFIGKGNNPFRIGFSDDGVFQKGFVGLMFFQCFMALGDILKKQVQQLSKQVDKAEKDAEKALKQTERDYRQVLKQLRTERDQLKKRLGVLAVQGESAFDDMRSGVESAAKDLYEAVTKAYGRFK